MRFLGGQGWALLLFASLLPFSSAHGAETLFNSKSAWNEEYSRLTDVARTFVRSPVDTYLWETAAGAGLLAGTFALDREIRSGVASTRGSVLGGFADAGALIGNPYLQLGVAGSLYGAGALADAPRLLEVGRRAGEALLLTDVAGFVLKEAAGRGRPETGMRNDRFSPFSFKGSYDSLPSIHTASSFALAHVLSRETESLPARLFCYGVAGFVGFSRLYREKHWASDIVLGAALGELAGSAVTRGRPGGVTVAPVLSSDTMLIALVGRY